MEKMHEIQKYNDCPHLLSRGGYDLLEKNLWTRKGRHKNTKLSLLKIHQRPWTLHPPFQDMSCERWLAQSDMGR